MKDTNNVEFTVTKNENSSLTSKIIIISALVISVLLLIIFFVPKINNLLTPSDDYIYAKIEGSNILDMQEYKNNVVLLTQTKTLYLEKNGNTHTGSVFTYSNPVMRVNNGNVLIYDRGGTGYRVERYRNTLYHDDAPGVIVTAAISKRSTVSFSVDSESDSFSQSCVYIKKASDSNIKNIYKSSSAYCIAITISDDDKYVAMAMLDGKNAENIITPVIYNIDNEEVITLEPISGVVLTGFDYLSNNTLALYTDSCIYHIDRKNYELTASDTFNSTDYISTSINPCGLTAVLLSGNGNKFTPSVKIFENNGELKNTIDFTDPIDKVSCSENHFAVLSDTDIYVYSHSGNLIGEFTTSDKNRNICVTDSNLFILQSSGVCITQLVSDEGKLFISDNNEESSTALPETATVSDKKTVN